MPSLKSPIDWFFRQWFADALQMEMDVSGIEIPELREAVSRLIDREVSAETVRQWVNGKCVPSLGVVFAIAECVHCDYRELMPSREEIWKYVSGLESEGDLAADQKTGQKTDQSESKP